ncbi:MurR/RpiR family transcriptional regulator [Nocardiopsis coralliicola]
MDETRPAQERGELTPGERDVAALAEQDPLRFATSTAADIARRAGTSEATVTRAAYKLGFEGIKDFKQHCASRAERGRGLGAVIRSRLDSLGEREGEQPHRSTAETVLTASAELLLHFAQTLDAGEFAAVADLVDAAPRTVVHGLGTGFHVADYLRLGLERIGRRAWSMSGSGHALADDVNRLDSGDLLVIVAPRVLLADTENLIGEAAGRVAHTVLLSQVRPPRRLLGSVRHLALPGTADSPASEVTGAWALADALVAELARRDPAAAIAARNDVQRLRDAFSPGARARQRR